MYYDDNDKRQEQMEDILIRGELNDYPEKNCYQRT